jgi:hypothetical protein
MSALLASLLLAAPAASAAKHQIAGKVVDQNGKSVTNVVVSVEPGNLQIATGADGAFLVDYLRDEGGERVKVTRKTDYAFEFFKAGFHTVQIKVRFVKGTVTMDPVALVPVALDVVDLGGNIDPALYDQSKAAEGATYEGQ